VGPSTTIAARPRCSLVPLHSAYISSTAAAACRPGAAAGWECRTRPAWSRMWHPALRGPAVISWHCLILRKSRKPKPERNEFRCALTESVPPCSKPRLPPAEAQDSAAAVSAGTHTLQPCTPASLTALKVTDSSTYACRPPSFHLKTCPMSDS
jgi:hypothetical protein